MSRRKLKWELAKYSNNYINYKSREFKSQFITRMLLNRGIKTKEEVHKFLYSDEKRLLGSIFVGRYGESVNKILATRARNEKITIYGDYDIDGISATAYLVIVLRKIGLNVDYYIPNRTHEGTKLNQTLVKTLVKRRKAGFVFDGGYDHSTLGKKYLC